jgi:hypothetical protein
VMTTMMMMMTITPIPRPPSPSLYQLSNLGSSFQLGYSKSISSHHRLGVSSGFRPWSVAANISNEYLRTAAMGCNWEGDYRLPL